MARSVAVKKYFTFVGGLNTEAGPLTYPPNTWQDGVNITPKIDGSLRKRYAINYESGYVLSTETNTLSQEDSFAFSLGEWNVVAGVGTRNFSVVQRGNMLYFYDNVATSASANKRTFSIDLTSYQAEGNPNIIGNNPITCTSSMGYLLITSKDTNPLVVSYDAETDAIEVSEQQLKLRDLYGVDDSLAVDERPETLSDAHKYNLLNQGWDATKIDEYFVATTKYPSSAQQWTSGKNSSDVFTPSLLDLQAFGTTPSPKGRFILDAFNRDRSTVSSVPNITIERELYRPTTCAFFAGRAWYAGVSSATMASWVFFSQVAETKEKFGHCYQDADPTSEFISDLVDSDGGIIPIQDAGTIVKLFPVDNSLLVFADNGVWQIVGGNDSGFSASSYVVRRISNVGCLNSRTVVEAEGAVYYWANDGIWALGKNQIGIYTAKNVTHDTIQTAYDNIPINSKTQSVGVYHLEAKRIYWIYASVGSDGVSNRFAKDKLLCLDARIGAFYTWAIESLAAYSPYVVDLLISKQKSAEEVSYDLITDTEETIVVGSSTVVTTINNEVATSTVVKFLTIVPAASTIKITFAEQEVGVTPASKVKDWYSADGVGVGYPAYVITGDDLGEKQGGDKTIQGVYLLAFFRRTETGVDSSGDAINPSSCMFQSRWDWTDSAIAGKWSTEREIYRHTRLWFPPVPSSSFNDGYPVVVTKNKIRGRGRSVVFKFAADEDKDMQLAGWAVTFIGNGNE